MADYLVNHTMDEQRSWSQIFGALPMSSFSGNLLLHFDGGTRSGSCSGAAWYLEAVLEKDRTRLIAPVAASGTYMADPVSSFTAELVAFDEATELISCITR